MSRAGRHSARNDSRALRWSALVRMPFGLCADLEAVPLPPACVQDATCVATEWRANDHEEGPLRRRGLTCGSVERTTGFEPATQPRQGASTAVPPPGRCQGVADACSANGRPAPKVR